MGVWVGRIAKADNIMGVGVTDIVDVWVGVIVEVVVGVGLGVLLLQPWSRRTTAILFCPGKL